MRTKFWIESLKARVHSEDLHADGNIIVNSCEHCDETSRFTTDYLFLDWPNVLSGSQGHRFMELV
jgi:hypothetical protein